MAGKRKAEEGGTAVLERPATAPAAQYVDTRTDAERAQAPTGVLTVTPSQAEGEAQFVLLPLEAIAESPWNPRKHFDPKELAELTASVALDGVWEPVLVRPHHSGHGVYELASGHRRYRASKAAGRTHIPALIRELSDETFLKLLTIANLQREDVHPLEQADAFAVQMKEFGWKPDRIARECGRGETFVYDHLKFLTLIPAVRDLFFANRISTAHAVELTRLTPAQQELAIDPIDGGLWEGEHLSHALELEMDEHKDPYAGLKAKTFRELKVWIQSYLRFDVTAADPVLFPSVPVVQAAAEQKFKVVAITWDDYPRDEVKKAPGAKLLTPTFWRRADGLDGSEWCEYSAKVIGVVESGPDQGAHYHVCLAREKCLVHWGERIKAHAKAAKEKESGKGATGAGTPAGVSSGEAPWEKRQRLSREAGERLAPLIPELRKLLEAKVRKASVTALVDYILEENDGELVIRPENLKNKTFPRGKSAEDFLRCAVWATIEWGLADQYDVAETLRGLAKAFGLDLKKLEREHAPAPAKAAPKAKPAATKKGAKR